MTLDEKKAARYKFLKAVYQAADGRTDEDVEYEKVAADLGFERDTTDAVWRYLTDEGLIEPMCRASICITHRGVVQVEDADSRPDRPTHYFPAVNTIYIAGDNRAPIQQGSHGPIRPPT